MTVGEIASHHLVCTFFLAGNSGCTKRVGLVRHQARALQSAIPYFSVFFFSFQLGQKESPRSALLPVKKSRRKTQNPYCMCNFCLPSFRRRCCRAHPRHCRLRPTPHQASWCPQPRCPRATWPWVPGAGRPPCQVGPAGSTAGASWGGCGTPTSPLFRRWSPVPARDDGDVAGPGPHPSHRPRSPADPQRPGTATPMPVPLIYPFSTAICTAETWAGGEGGGINSPQIPKGSTLRVTQIYHEQGRVIQSFCCMHQAFLWVHWFYFHPCTSPFLTQVEENCSDFSWGIFV